MNDSNLYNNLLLKKAIYIKPSLLNKNLNDSIKTKIIDKYNGKCTSEGYIKKDSIIILKRTIGIIDGSNFKGFVKFNIVFSADICNPVNGSIITCDIKNINKLGLFAQDGPLSIIVPKDYHESKESFKDLNIGDTITVEVLGKQFQLNDTVALLIGRLSGDIVKKKFIIKKIKLKNKKVELFDDSGLEEVTDGEKDEENLTDNLMNNDETMIDEFEDLGESENDYLEDKEEVSFDADDTDTENTDAEDTDAEDTDAEDTDADDTDVEDADVEDSDEESSSDEPVNMVDTDNVQIEPEQDVSESENEK
tara:strand:- start:5206 stop:6126 length:921 start_codon:yes stop_codon:yes gene_type:complete